MYIPAGTYLISDVITLPPTTRLVGDGATLRATTKQAKLYLSNVHYASHIRISGIKFDGNNIADVGIEINHCANNTLSNVWVENCVGHGLYLHGGVWCNHISGSIFRNNQNGICISSLNATEQANINVIDDLCVMSGNREAGIRLIGGVGNQINSCDIEMNGGYGIHQTEGGGSHGLKIINSHFERNGGTNIRIAGDGQRPHWSATVQGNHIFGGAGLSGACDYGLDIADAPNMTVTSNFYFEHVVAPFRQAGKCDGLDRSGDTELFA